MLTEHELTSPLEFALTVEDREILLEAAAELDPDELPQPQVMLLSTGEVTPFTADIYRDAFGGRYTLVAEFDGKMEISSSGF